tara:strand:+ start:843 stop:1193 length:351 start_codon:yes stop_codon:yes gene_type:complete
MPSSGRGMAISAWLTGIYFVIEMGIGLWTGSIAVISDAFHTFSAVGGVLVAIIAAKLAHRPADEDRSFGWYRAEIIGGCCQTNATLSLRNAVRHKNLSVMPQKAAATRPGRHFVEA